MIRLFNENETENNKLTNKNTMFLIASCRLVTGKQDTSPHLNSSLLSRNFEEEFLCSDSLKGSRNLMSRGFVQLL